MSKTKIILLVVLVLVILAGSGLGIYLFSRRSPQGQIPNALTGIANIIPVGPKATADKTYVDEAGFSFSYPKSVKVEDVTPDDGTIYSLLKLSSGDKQLSIKVADTKYKTVEQWVAKDKEAPLGLALSGATTLGRVPASQYTVGEKLLTVAIDQGVVYVIEGPKDSGFWEDTQNLLVSSFSFADTQKAAGTSESNIVYEEEEVVE